MTYRILATLMLACFAARGAPTEFRNWRSWMEHGNELRQAGNYAEAAAAYSEALRISAKDGPMQRASSLNSLAMAYDDLGQQLESQRCYRSALTLLEEAGGHHSLARAQILVNLSGVSLHTGQITAAEKLLREAMEIYDDLAAPDSLPYAVARNCLGEALLWRGAVEEAARLVEQARTVLKNAPPGKGYHAMCLNNWGSVLWLQGRKEEAMQTFRQAQTLLELELGGTNPVLIYPLNNLGIALLKTGGKQEAEQTFARALRIAELHLGQKHPVYATLLMNYALSLRKVGRKAEAKSLELRAEGVIKESASKNGTGFTVDISALRAK